MEKQNLTTGARTIVSGEMPVVRWVENGEERLAAWRSEAGVAAPQRVQLADDTLNADTAYRLACEGTALLWRGDFQNARQLLQAVGVLHRRNLLHRDIKPDNLHLGSLEGPRLHVLSLPYELDRDREIQR